jgi:tRNA-2-methylthio-N6-dimethylallyladenosine synthase
VTELSPVTRKFLIKTYGCQMNVYDSARMADVLKPLGFSETTEQGEADLIILNTCHIREKAAEKVFSELGRLRLLKEERRALGQETLLAVGGCVAQAEGEEILRRAPYVDLVFGPQTYHRLPDLVARAGLRAELKAGGVLDNEFPPEPKFDSLPETGARGPAAFLAVQEGCDKFCTYCVVPYTRGPEYCRPPAAVMNEAQRLVGSGASEITLIGQNVNAWKAEGWSFGRLIRELAKIDGVLRLRYTTSHPAEIDDALIAAHRDVAKLAPYLHLPVQSGSDRILKAMNRGHTAEEYLALAARLKAARPDLALSTDFIVGFPGETEEDFEETLELVRQAGFVQAYSFKYSSRPGTPAAALPNQVPERLKAERLRRLQALLAKTQSLWYDGLVGQEIDVLFDRPGRRKGQLLGRGPAMQPVHVKAPHTLMNRMARVRIASGGANSLAGELVEGWR